MIPNTKDRSVLPWIILPAILSACFLCIFCPVGATGVYWLSRSAPSHPTTLAATSTLLVTATDFTTTTPIPAEPTASPTIEGSTDPDAWRQAGDANAKVVVEEFADFQCPYCGDFHARGEPRLWEEYIRTGKVRFIFRNFPVLDGGDMNGESHLAALGALCAGEQGKFWKYHDFLFENQTAENSGGFTFPHLLEFAVKLDLNGSSFGDCLQSRRYQSVLDDDLQLGSDGQLSGVPTFFINGRVVLGYNERDFFGAIDNALEG
jgi:protein-disulfide isomerase